MTPQQFIAKWQAANLSERSACQQHFLDLCELLGEEKPAAADPEGAWYCFERGVSKTEGGQGWADVWMRGHFGWEYKGKHKDLAAAYKQLLQYRESLENPPLLVVCDLNRFEIHTNFTGTAKRVYDFDLAGLAQPKNLDVLRKLFTDPDALRPGITSQTVTDIVSEKFGLVADAMRQRKVPPQEVAHFLMKLMFSMFAEDVELLPGRIFSRTLKQSKNVAAKLSDFLRELFEAMAHGGTYAMEEILHFNGGLFADANVIDLRPDEIQHLAEAADQDWSSVEPHIFGTLFERLLDPEKRSQIGAHYTSSDDIKTLLEPVMMAPLRREWTEVKAKCEALLPALAEEARKAAGRRAGKESKPRKQFDRLILDFDERLSHVTVLDPACGSGNFLYLALRLLLDLEKEVITFAANHQLGMLPQVRPTQLHGIEINPFAQELASVVIWIGYLQWMRDNGFTPKSNPVLEPIESIERRDAILDLSDPENPKEPNWPEAEFIVGNPPFLGGNRIRQGLGDQSVDAILNLYRDRVPGFSDLCCYWFEKSRRMIELKKARRAGLLATQGIRGGVNRTVLERIEESGSIFFAVADREWILDGAMVHVSLVGFDDGSERVKELNGHSVQSISPALASSLDVTKAVPLRELQAVHIEGVKKGAKFEIGDEVALSLLSQPNPNGRPNSDVVLPYLNGAELYGGDQVGWIIYYPPGISKEEASRYEAPFEMISKTVFPKYGKKRSRWWIHERARPELQSLLHKKSRYIATVKHSKHRVFVWVPAVQLVSNAIELIAQDDDYFFGVLQSQIHEKWGRAPGMGTQLRERESGFRYTPTTCFETFPFPEPTDEQRRAIGDAARELDQLRSAWLNPPEWTRTEILEFPGSVDGPWARYIAADAAEKPKAESGEPKSGTGYSSISPGDWRRIAASVKELQDEGVLERATSSPDRNPPKPGLRGRESIAATTGPGGKSSSQLTPDPLPVKSQIGTVRYPRLAPRDAACAKELKKRTLTNLYNQRPAWLDLAHRKLDEAVFAAYGWPATLSDDELLARLLELNLARASAAGR